MTRNRAIVYITDAGFLMPSLFSASQIASNSKVLDVADIFLILVGVTASEKLKSSFAHDGIQFLELEKSAFWRKDDTFFNQTHVPVTSLGRLVMQSVLPDSYEHVLYLDGDTYIAGDIESLVEHTVARGKIAAANDCSWLSRGRFGSFWRAHSAYCSGLGIADPSSYFNAGVLAFRMESWREMAPKALDFFEDNPQLCRYHDQSALNAVFQNRRETLSPAWNYQSDYSELGCNNQLRPRIFHFTGGHKPWQTRNSVWGPAIFDEYTEFMNRYPVLEDIHPLKKRFEAEVGRTYRERFDVRNIVRNIRRTRKRAMFRNYLANTKFAV